MRGSIVAFNAFGESVISDRRATSLDGRGQNCPDCSGKPDGGLAIKGYAGSLWVDSGSKEGFVGVDVSNARKHRLIKQGDFHGPVSPAESRLEGLAVDFGRFRSEPAEEAVVQITFIPDQMDATESPWVDESDSNHVSGDPPEGPDHMSVGWDRSYSSDGEIQPSGHPETNHQTAASIKTNQKLLPSAIDRLNSLAFTQRCCCEAAPSAAIQSTNHVSSKDTDSINLAPDHHGREHLADRFDFGEFGHGVDFVRSPSAGAIGSGW